MSNLINAVARFTTVRLEVIENLRTTRAGSVRQLPGPSARHCVASALRAWGEFAVREPDRILAQLRAGLDGCEER